MRSTSLSLSAPEGSFVIVKSCLWNVLSYTSAFVASAVRRRWTSSLRAPITPQFAFRSVYRTSSLLFLKNVFIFYHIFSPVCFFFGYPSAEFASKTEMSVLCGHTALRDVLIGWDVWQTDWASYPCAPIPPGQFPKALLNNYCCWFSWWGWGRKEANGKDQQEQVQECRREIWDAFLNVSLSKHRTN